MDRQMYPRAMTHTYKTRLHEGRIPRHVRSRASRPDLISRGS